MNAPHISLVEIKVPTHPLFHQWLDLYETAFSPSEKLLVSTILKMLEESRKKSPHHLMAITDQNDAFAGMMLYETKSDVGLALLWYLAIQPERRNQGIGSLIFQELLRRLNPSIYRALFFEVEIPAKKNREEAERRIAFYQRNGAFLLRGIHYLQNIGWHHPPTPMHIMMHPLIPMDAEQAFALAKIPFGDALQKRGVLALR